MGARVLVQTARVGPPLTHTSSLLLGRRPLLIGAGLLGGGGPSGRTGGQGSRGVIMAGSSSDMKIDSHLHVWANAEQREEFPFPGGEPPYPGNAELLLESMKAPGVHGALIVQPANHKFDHSYVSSVMAKYPGRFVGCLLADPTEGGGGVAELERLVIEEGYRAVRFNPYLWPEGKSMTDEVGCGLYKRAGELGVPVGIMTFKGLLNHIDDIENLCQTYPETKTILDHFGFCKCKTPDSDEWKALLALAKYPQVYVKCSAFFRVSEEPYPYMDARPMLRRLVDIFGSDRLLWGTDFPWITEQCGYTKAWSILDDGDAQAGEALLSPEERRQMLGMNLVQLFPGGWY